MGSDVSSDLVRDALLFCPRRRHRFREASNCGCQSNFSLPLEDIRQIFPAFEHSFARLKERGLGRLDLKTAPAQLARDKVGTRPHVRRLPAQHCPVNAIPLCHSLPERPAP